MKKITAVAIFTLVVFSAIAQAPKEKALLWKIKTAQQKQPSYLYGTLHLLCPDQLKIAEEIKKSFSATKQLFLEIDLDDPQMMAKAMKGLLMKDSIKLINLVSKADYDSMNKVFTAKAGFPLGMMGNAKPLLLMSLVLPSLLKCNPDGWEKHFQAMAKEKKIPLKGLETIEYQMRVFDTIPYKAQAEMLKGLLYNLDSTKNTFAEMVQVYKNQDIDAMQAMTVKDPEFGQFEATMLLNRNNNWIPIIIAEINTTPTFIAVGAAHLGGENGVISLLRKKGYTVTPVKY